MSPLLLVLAVWTLLSVLVVAGLCLLLHGRSVFNPAPQDPATARDTAWHPARTPSSEPAARRRPSRRTPRPGVRAAGRVAGTTFRFNGQIRRGGEHDELIVTVWTRRDQTLGGPPSRDECSRALRPGRRDHQGRRGSGSPALDRASSRGRLRVPVSAAAPARASSPRRGLRSTDQG